MEKTLQLRGRNYIISTKIWSRLQKRPPMQNFTITVLTVSELRTQLSGQH